MYRLFVLGLFMPDIADAMIQSGEVSLVVGAESQNCWIGKTGLLVSCLAMELVSGFGTF